MGVSPGCNGGGRDGIYKPNYCDRLNGPIQSRSADMLYLALEKLLEGTGLPRAEILITTHDEIVLEVPEGASSAAAGWIYDRMRESLHELIGEEVASGDCVEVEVGPSWGGR